MMTNAAKHDAWRTGQSYEQYMGRWSRQIATKFLKWLDAPSGAGWLDLGCGTGALSQAVLDNCSPASIIGIDPSKDFIAHARNAISDHKASFKVADAENLPLNDTSIDIVSSALALNFVPDRKKALQEMFRVCRKDGLISFYVWDYPGGGMGFIDAFWRAAAELDPAAQELDEGTRFPFCTQIGLQKLCDEAGLSDAAVMPIEISTEFPSFEDFWQPFALGAGPAPGYYVGLDADQQVELHEILARNIGAVEPISFVARAWAVKWARR